MRVARVVGEVVSTHKHREFRGHKLLLVRNLGLGGEPEGGEYIVLDTVDAGRGDRVLVNKEGGGARLALGNDRIPVQALAVGVVDGWQVEGGRDE